MSQKLYDFASSLVGNRVLDLYLKYQGILTLSSTTLVPIALILGKDALQDYLRNAKRGVDQSGGGVHIPVLDAPGIGTYLKLAGLTTLPINAATLVPLGVLMAVYQMFENQQQQGGAEPDSNMFYDFARGLVGNRVLDLFLKYKGIMTLNAYTLVPIALILGKDTLIDYVRSDRKGSQLGGRPLRLPIADDPLIGNYLKVAGLATVPITTGTLLPLGVLMVVYELYKDQLQLGGTYSKDSAKTKSLKKTSRTGGSVTKSTKNNQPSRKKGVVKRKTNQRGGTIENCYGETQQRTRANEQVAWQDGEIRTDYNNGVSYNTEVSRCEHDDWTSWADNGKNTNVQNRSRRPKIERD